MSNFDKMMKELEIADVPLATRKYQIQILRETDNEILGQFNSSDFNFEFYYSPSGLQINGEDKRIDYLKDVIKVLSHDYTTHGCPPKLAERYPDILIDSQYWEARMEVARQGYGIEKLINDENWYVRDEARRSAYEFNLDCDDCYDCSNILIWESPYDIFDDHDLLFFDLDKHGESEIVNLLKKVYNPCKYIFYAGDHHSCCGMLAVFVQDRETEEYYLLTEEDVAEMGENVSHHMYGIEVPGWEYLEEIPDELLEECSDELRFYPNRDLDDRVFKKLRDYFKEQGITLLNKDGDHIHGDPDAIFFTIECGSV